MDILQTNSSKNDNSIIPEEISIKVEPELVLLDDDDGDYNDNNAEYGQDVSICQDEYENYDEYDGPEVGNADTYMSYDDIQLQNELEMSPQNNVGGDVILIESDSDENEGSSSDMKISYECHLCFKTVATSYNLKRHMMIHSGN